MFIILIFVTDLVGAGCSGMQWTLGFSSGQLFGSFLSMKLTMWSMLSFFFLGYWRGAFLSEDG